MTTMKILVAGAQGQLARALVDAARERSDFDVAAFGRPGLDLADVSTIERAIDAVKPDLVVNAAAYTAVDRAETDCDAAFAINSVGAGALAEAAKAGGCPIIHVSTDYVFDGSKTSAYVETDPTSPMTVYGRSKLAGELAVAVANPQHVILRTAWVFSAHGHNFLRTIMRLAQERPELCVVSDQRGNPTYAPHLANAILAVAHRLSVANPPPWGIYHAAGSGDTSWHGLALATIQTSARLDVPQVPIIPINTAEYRTPAKRPANSRLNCAKLERLFAIRLPPWQQGVDDCVTALGSVS